jgi:hypothetical protein
MNRFKSSTKLPSRKRERDLRHNEFHAVLLGVAGRDLRQGVQVIRRTDEWLSCMLNADADKQRLQLGEPVVGRLTEQLDSLAGALRLYENTVTTEPSPVPQRLSSTAVRQKGLRLRRRAPCPRPPRARASAEDPAYMLFSSARARLEISKTSFSVNGAGIDARYTTSAPFMASPRPFSG